MLYVPHPIYQELCSHPGASACNRVYGYHDGQWKRGDRRCSGRSFQFSQSYEGIEGLSITIDRGDISLVASDDGLNAAGGNDSSGFGGRGGDIFASTDGAVITISSGTLHVNASGDGIDSNGDLIITGGEIYVSGPTDSGNGTLDYAGEAVISGGTFVAAESSGMAQNFSSSSTQGETYTLTTGSNSTEITMSSLVYSSGGMGGGPGGRH